MTAAAVCRRVCSVVGGARGAAGTRRGLTRACHPRRNETEPRKGKKMSSDSGLWATLAVVLPSLAAAPFLLAAAYIVARLVKASADERELPEATAPAVVVADEGARVVVKPLDGAADAFDTAGSPPLGTHARRAHDELL